MLRLRLQPNHPWAIVRHGHAPQELTFGDLFRIEVHGELVTTSMEFRQVRRGGGEYYSVDGYERSGLPAAVGA